MLDVLARIIVWTFMGALALACLGFIGLLVVIGFQESWVPLMLLGGGLGLIGLLFWAIARYANG